MTTFGPYEALGTIWYVECFSSVDTDKLSQVVTEHLHSFEARYSRFRTDSWLSQLNQTGVCEDPDSEFVTLLRLALIFAEVTQDTFNIAVGEQIQASGYDAQYSFTQQAALPAVPPLATVLGVTEERITLTDGALDLGGYAKGFCIDRLAEKLEMELECEHFLINGGGDIYVSSNQGEPIEITLAHPTNQAESIGAIKLKDQGFAASSPFVRCWQDANTGQAQNHLLTQNKLASYVVAKETVTADAWATTLAIEPTLDAPEDVEVLLVEKGRIRQKGEGFVLFG